jgi:hypothetical protein
LGGQQKAGPWFGNDIHCSAEEANQVPKTGIISFSVVASLKKSRADFSPCFERNILNLGCGLDLLGMKLSVVHASGHMGNE